MADTAAVIDALQDVADPCCAERGISVVDMGLVHHVAVDAGTARVELILTSGWCPFVIDLVGTISERLHAVPGLDQADVEVVWDEPWDASRMSDEAHRKLRFLPEPRDADTAAVHAAARAPLPLVDPPPSAQPTSRGGTT